MPQPQKTVGVYERPAKPKWPWFVVAAVLILAVIITVVMFRNANAATLDECVAAAAAFLDRDTRSVKPVAS